MFSRIRCIILLLFHVNAVKSVIVTKPADAAKLVGENVELKCVTAVGDCSFVDWQKQEDEKTPNYIYQAQRNQTVNKELFDPLRYNVTKKECTLSIKNLRLEDSGKFICTEIRPGEPESTHSATLVVVRPATQCKMNPAKPLMEKGENISVNCAVVLPATGVQSSTFSLSWFNDTTLLKSVPSQREEHVSVTHEGVAEAQQSTCNLVTYTCKFTVTNTSPPVTLDICETLTRSVTYPVENIRFSPDKSSFVPGDEVTVTADGCPEPQYTWIYNKTKEKFHNKTIVISMTSESDDVYTCIASNTIVGRSPHEVTKTATVTSSGSSTALVAGVVAVITIGILATVIIIIICLLRPTCYLYKYLHRDKPSSKPNKEKEVTAPLYANTNDANVVNRPTANPPKPPRLHSQDNLRAGSEVEYAQLAPEPHPRRLNNAPVNNSTTEYACIRHA